MKSLVLASFFATCGFASAQPAFYGGDFDGTGGIASERNTVIDDARVYDDFALPEATQVRGVWGNYLLFNFYPKQANFEIRQMVRRHDGGQLIASGTVNVTILLTGRADFGTLEYHIRAPLGPLSLAAGTYWVALAPIGYGFGRCFLSETGFASDRGPVEDPNPPPTGSPLDNSNAFFDSGFFGYDYEEIESLTGFGVDFSYGVGTLTSVAPYVSLADGFQVTRGSFESGELPDLWGSDDRRVQAQQRAPFNAASPNAQIELETFAPNGCGRGLSLMVETACSGQPPANVTQRVELFDFVAQAWVMVDDRAATSSDRTLVINAPSQPGRFSEPLTFRQLARISWLDRGVLNLGWSVSIDNVVWQGRP